MIMAVSGRSLIAAAFLLAISLVAAGCGNRDRPSANAETAGEPRSNPTLDTARQPQTNSPNRASIEDTRAVIAAFGDSISAGFGVEPGRSYPDDLQQLIDAGHHPYRVVNAGVSGDTTTDGVVRLPAVLALHPAIAILEFGGNDGLRGLPVASAHENLARMITELQAAGCTVILAGMTLPRNYGPEYIHSFDQMYTDLARKYKTTLIPFVLQGVGGNPELTQPDGIHPTAEGARIVAHTVMEYLQPFLHEQDVR
jgi:acyl-CoA thioesterase I